MKISLSPTAQINIEGRAIGLLGGVPVINQERISDYQAELIRDDETQTIIGYTLPKFGGCVFTVEIHKNQPGVPCFLTYKLEHLDPSLQLLSFGLAFESIDNLRAYFRNGYFSWDGSDYVDAEAMFDFEDYEDRFETGYAMTQLVPLYGEDNILLGFDRNDRFQHTFTFDTRCCPYSLTLLTLWDDKTRDEESACESERLFLFEQRGAEAGLRQWAALIAAASPTPPRLACPPIMGWSSWYNLYSYISEDIILDQLAKTKKVVEKEGIPLWVFQVDDGFTPEMGDWLAVKPQFPHGMKYVMDQIRAAGFTPGLWIAPLMVGNRSQLYQAHPDWVVIDKKTMRPFVEWNHNGEYRWHKRSEEYYILDTTHPDAFEYLRTVFRTWRHDWGCEYFKTDFMHFGTGYGPDEVIRHTPGKTRIEIWREVAEMIREEIGEDATWLGCGCPLWASIGLVDGVRIANDIGVSWAGNLSAESLLRDLAARNFANQVLWQVDPDCILLRDQYHNLSAVEVRSLALYAGMSGGVVMTSDDLEAFSPERIALLKLLCNPQRSACRFPLLGQASIQYDRVGDNRKQTKVHHRSRSIDPVMVEYRPGRSDSDDYAGVVFIFNTGDYPLQRTYPLELFGISTPMYLFNWTENQAHCQAVDRIQCTLQPHDGALFFLSQQPLGRNRPDRLL